MTSIRVSYESKRGCGYRKQGGLYMVSGKPSAPCGKLPVPLHVCPTCAQGIKPQRAFAWIQPRPLFAAVECMLPGFETEQAIRRQVEGQWSRGECLGCPAGSAVPERAGLIWVGGKFYETAEAFMAEARTMGISRRIPAVPRDFEAGKTWVYLAHRECKLKTPISCPECVGVVVGKRRAGEECEVCKGAGVLTNGPAIFTAFVPHAVEYVVKGTETEDELEKIEKRGIELVDVRQNQEELPFDATPAERANVPGGA